MHLSFISCHISNSYAALSQENSCEAKNERPRAGYPETGAGKQGKAACRAGGTNGKGLEYDRGLVLPLFAKLGQRPCKCSAATEGSWDWNESRGEERL